MDRIMDFQSEYKKIADCVKQDISDFEKFCSSMFSENTDIEDFPFYQSSRSYSG